MNENILIKNGTLVLRDRLVENGSVLLSGGKIAMICENEPPCISNIEIYDAGGMYISPGFIDIHAHGGGGSDFMDDDIEAIESALDIHTQHGTTVVYPTTLACKTSEIFRLMDNVGKIKKKGRAEVLGLHLEGPYFAVSQKGAQDPAYIKHPYKSEYLKILEYSDLIKRWTYAPELSGACEFTEELVKRGIVPSLGHSDADYAAVKAVYDRGARLMTHFYSCMSGVHRINGFRKLGMIESGYLLDEMDVEIIADNRHLPPELIRLICKIKSPEHVALVTDAMRGAGCPDGESILGSRENGQKVILKDGVAYMPDFQAFAGSIATTDILVRTLYKEVGFSLPESVFMASVTPARIMNVSDRKGELKEGNDADIAIFDDNICVRDVFIAGTRRIGFR